MRKKEYQTPNVKLLLMMEEIVRTSGGDPYVEDGWDEWFPALGNF